MSDSLMAVIDQLYGAALDAARWPDALAETVRLLGGLGGTIEIYSKQPTLQTEFFHVFDLSREGAQLYADHYRNVCPRFGPTLTSSPGDVRYDYVHHDEDTMNHSEFYQDFLRNDGLRYYLSGTLENNHERLGIFSIQRTPSQGHATKHEITLAHKVLPHLRRSIALSQRLMSAEGTLWSLMDAVNFGVLILEADGRIHTANQAARELLRQHPGLNDDGKIFGLSDRRLNGLFCASLLAVHDLVNHNLHDPPAPVLVPRVGEHDPVLVVVSPILAEHTILGFDGWPSGRGKQALVILHCHKPNLDAWLRPVQEHFGLTASEAALTRSLLTGRSLREHADRQRITLNTVKTHWAHVRSKTGCRTQAELIRRLNALMPPLRRDRVL